jgi:hypothetical protein
MNKVTDLDHALHMKQILAIRNNAYSSLPGWLTLEFRLLDLNKPWSAHCFQFCLKVYLTLGLGIFAEYLHPL